MTTSQRPVNISQEALDKVREQCLKRSPAPRGLRMGIRGGGCAGFSYAISFEDNDVSTNDVEFEENGVTFIIDKRSLPYLTGSTLVWKKTLMSSGFMFVNPNEESQCGCGRSFVLKHE